ncbi:MAG: hypothetical protein HY305_00355 [Sphingobacteriales bacterium]|nr:hypothetical protein [Sphingobacteriales bacterium]
MKKYILLLTAFAAVGITSCRKIEMDGEKEYIIVHDGGSNTGKTVQLSGRITRDTTLLSADENILKGLVYITNGVTLTIEKGATVKGSYSGSDVATLIVARGGKIVAKGTAEAPIIFTSSSPNPQSGDWGGIVLCGKAAINASFLGTTGLYQVEGGVDNGSGDGLAGSGDAVAPTPVNDDSTGVLSYVRIQYAGYAFQPDKEINSLTLAAVGSRTVIDHIQVAYAKDDAFEWFGGTVNCKYLIAYKTQDDDFDTDNGYSGNVQFGIILRDSVIADISKSESFESDNNATGSTVTPKTSAIFSNITVVGPRATLNNIGNSLFLAGAQIRRNSALSIFNSVFIGWPIGILIDAGLGSPTDLNIDDSTLRIRYTTIAGCNTPLKYTASGSSPTGKDDAAITAWFTTAAFGNTIVTNTTDAKLIQPFNYSAPDPTPFAGANGYAPIVSGANFTDPKLVAHSDFFTTVAFRGGIAPAGIESSWWKGWTKF